MILLRTLRTPKIARLLAICAGLALCCAALRAPAFAQTASWTQRMANTTMTRWPNGDFEAPGHPMRWNYALGVLLNGMNAAWYNSADGADFHYIQRAVDQLVTPSGAIPTYKPQAYELDSIAMGPSLLMLYRVTQNPRYYKAAELLRKQLETQPRNASGGFWHKKIYPNQMWLDGLYMAEPFYAEYASLFDQPQDFADITKQFVLMDEHARDPKTGLLYHGWDESKKQAWANKVTGDSPNFWGRGMGWYMMALVDTLPYYPKDNPGRAKLLAILNQTAAAIVRAQDPQTGLWYEVLNEPHTAGNYPESSASCMFVYALAKGVRLGYLPPRYAANALRGWQGILAHFIKVGSHGMLTLTGTVQVVGLGGHPYRSGSYHYYVSQPVVSNDPKGVGAFMLAASEMAMAPHATLAHGDTVMMDGWFNSQHRTNAAGESVLFHYKWDDLSNTGYSLTGHVFRSYGANLATLDEPPTLARLKNAQIYFIVSPDIPKWNPHPHYMNRQDADQIAAWVKRGGVLVMMENDPGNADIPHMNLLAGIFGIHFDPVLLHHIVDEKFDPGFIRVAGDGPAFHHPHLLYMKDTCGITVKSPAKALVTDSQGIVMATAKYGRGTVVAVVDPWIYNEYTDHRKTRPTEENFAADREFVRWLIAQIPNQSHAAAQ